MKKFFALNLGGGWLIVSLLLLYGCTTETIGSDPTEQFPD